jgi:hypothetical protein
MSSTGVDLVLRAHDSHGVRVAGSASSRRSDRDARVLASEAKFAAVIVTP